MRQSSLTLNTDPFWSTALLLILPSKLSSFKEALQLQHCLSFTPLEILVWTLSKDSIESFPSKALYHMNIQNRMSFFHKGRSDNVICIIFFVATVSAFAYYLSTQMVR